MTDSTTIDGFGPLPVRRPTTPTEVGEIVREAAAAGHALYPVGGGTRLDLGLPPTKPGLAVATGGLAGVIDYPARDMTVTVEAGITTAKLAEVLAGEGQWLPVDLPSGDRGTLGGAIAANLSGPRRFGRGTLRDYLIGVRFVADDGADVGGGGRVVKNVAGYDLMKLHVGALGSFGIITQATLKVFPKPESQALIAFGLSAAAVGPTLDRLHASDSRPVAVELLNVAATKAMARVGLSLPAAEPWAIVVGFEDKAKTVAWQVETLKGELKTAPVRELTAVTGSACDAVWAALVEFQDRPESAVILKANVPPSRVAEFAGRVTIDGEMAVQAHALTGIVWLHAHASTEAAPKFSAVAQAAHDCGGNLVARRYPAEAKRSIAVWGRPGSDEALRSRIKAALDPNDLFNPGRMFG